MNTKSTHLWQEPLHQIDPDGYKDIPSSWFGEETSQWTQACNTFWSNIVRIHREATRAQQHQKDENAWSRIVWDLLELGIHQANATRVEVVGVSV